MRAKLGSVELWEQAGNGLLRPDQLPCAVAELPAVFTQFRTLVEQGLQVDSSRNPRPTIYPSCQKAVRHY